MVDEGLVYAPIADCAGWIRSRALSPVELLVCLLDRVVAHDDKTCSFVTVAAENALEQARVAEREIAAGRWCGPLHGIPFAAKDVFCTAGMRTTGHSRLRQDYVPEFSATAVTKLESAGAILVGKLATHEFAHGGPSDDLPWPPARNPWNTEHFSGGSSTGSAVAVAAGYVKAALGTDTGGSVRSPAAHCGVAGLKPTYGRIGRGGVFPNAFTLDHCGVLAWRARDCAVLLQALAGGCAKDPTAADHPVDDYSRGFTASLRGTRIGVVRHFYEADLPAPDTVVDAMASTLEVFRDLGAELVPVVLPSLEEFSACKITIQLAELYTAYERDLRDRPECFGADFRRKVLPGAFVSAVDYLQAQRKRKRLAAHVEKVFADCDLLVTASTYGPAPTLRDAMREKPVGRLSITHPFNVTGHPAISICNGFSNDGLPLGLQIAGRYFDEARVLGAADAYERATTWRDRYPALSA